MRRPGPDFERCADDYERHAILQAEVAGWLAEWLPARLDGDVLELGAGTGLFTRHLAPRAARLVATDIAPSMVAAGRHAVPGARWLPAAAEAPPPGPWRWVLSCSLVQWLDDPAAVLRCWRTSSQQDAVFLGGWFVKGTLARFLETCPQATPFPWRGAEDWLELLRGAGWAATRHETRSFVRVHPGTVEMLREVHHVGAVVPRRLGPGVLRRAIRAHDAADLGRQGLATPFVFLRVEARAV